MQLSVDGPEWSYMQAKQRNQERGAINQQGVKRQDAVTSGHCSRPTEGFVLTCRRKALKLVAGLRCLFAHQTGYLQVQRSYARTCSSGVAVVMRKSLFRTSAFRLILKLFQDAVSVAYINLYKIYFKSVSKHVSQTCVSQTLPVFVGWRPVILYNQCKLLK